MPIPYFEDMLVPIFNHIAEHERYDKKKGERFVARNFKLTDTEKKFRPLWGFNPDYFGNPVNELIEFSLSTLVQRGLLQYKEKAYYSITLEGMTLQKKGVIFEDIDKHKLKKDNWSNKFSDRKYDYLKKKQKLHEYIESVNHAIANNTTKISENSHKPLIPDLLDKITSYHHSKFEQVIVRIISDLYKGEGQHTRLSKDDGIDGIINIYNGDSKKVLLVQVKKYSLASISLDNIKSFTATVDKYLPKAAGGVFFTTSSFSEPAKRFIKNSADYIKLMDLTELVNLMVENNIGTDSRDGIQRKDDLYFQDIFDPGILKRMNEYFDKVEQYKNSKSL